ncbi:phosphotransferase enzyme family protein [Paenibacillus tundrae]|uniref:Ser/Thr protein kinase RdoA (MazF antagonist) n=1 Tax=Paenibacillus tundrae TaxID=528187 RepID=A0ABT9WHS4_9BACL|nr:phosphotransferase [Paenibacillus tundrae]MDQ0172811.1 Ser/Thr protein kinase RdoA (MazF antagonist) [Paenibacillus tundrae]
MLKLNYLFHNHDLAEMILKQWDYDVESLDMFQHYRISSNAVYPFRFQEEVRLLRFAPVDEKDKSNIEAELAFLHELHRHQYGALEAVPAHTGEELVQVHTPWGAYYASVFKRVPGISLARVDLDETIVHGYGQALGKLHNVSRQYVPEHTSRWTYTEVLNWMQGVLAGFPDETEALNEVDAVRTVLASWPVTKQNFGLIHYDFELDNVFYDQEDHAFYAIDFDDAMVHWYAMDVQQSLDSLQEEIEPEHGEQMKQSFMQGYWSVADETVDMEMMFPACRRFANLYGYVRILRSAAQQWAHEPEWMCGLRERLEKAMVEKAKLFGQPLS